MYNISNLKQTNTKRPKKKTKELEMDYNDYKEIKKDKMMLFMI